ncbi:GNAT family N-acetyltransferase [Gordonia sp. HY285]|uniref:bifunctional acetate--CoA ligase family protein/GNAT family N-acetyltransferase n=1 Tax=Gordonia liuliyuniae TaxID=2911517 RepID=UPI001EFF6D06|nr:bifunctional GNAT family N-acetyltransferase/acetate--CoA ligase family protein [Gordonia liuliyuniae]MCF8610797.1 GNAT family N-acetyltransferase [Gordonia liuliyuniae]
MTETDYPRDWVADVLASDGGVVHLRPIVPADADALVAFHNGLSERTRYLRYFGPTPTLPPREVVRMTTIDYHDRVAFLAMLGDEIIAMGVYEGLAADGKPESAEVAFVVADDHQGRGLGPILLEHLAGAAAESGFTRFEAEVLSENPNMVAVFRDAGYQVSRAFDGSTVHVEFLIDPSEALTSVRNARERASEARSIANLLRPQSIAVIGASTDAKKVGNVLLANIIAAGFTGPVFPVNTPTPVDENETPPVVPPTSSHFGAPVRRPAREPRPAPPSVRGIRAYPTVRDIPDPVDLAVVAVPAAGMDAVLSDCLAKGVRTLVVVSSGFGESGEAGLESERRLTERVRAHGMRLVGPNALGVANNSADIALNATLAPRVPGAGRVGFFCQSGALGIAILDTAAHRQLGLSTFVSAGNRADVSGNDVLQYWDSDESTDVVLLYLESFGNPRKFGRIARRVASSKPIVAIKSGRGAMTQTRASRTRKAGGDDAIAQMILGQAGVIQVETITELFDCGTILAYQPLPAGPRTAIIGNSSVIAALAAATARSSGLDVVATVDLGPAVSRPDLSEAVAVAMADDTVDAVIVVFVPPVAVDADDYAHGLMEAVRPADGGSVPDKPVVTTFLAVEGVPEGLSRPGPDRMPVRGSIPSYSTPERAAKALAHAWKYAAWKARPAAEIPTIEGTVAEDARSFVREAMADGARDLTAVESAHLLRHYGIDVVAFREVRTMQEASAAARELGFPVAVKATSESWIGRLDREGARLDLPDVTAVLSAFTELRSLTGDDVLHVQKMAPKGLGTSIAVSDNESFGPLLSFGLSGRLFDALGDRGYRAVPLTEVDARELIAEPQAAMLLSGGPVDDPVDTDQIIDLILRISALVDEVPEVREVRCDPVLASADGVALLGARIHVGPVPTLADTGPRRLG